MGSFRRSGHWRRSRNGGMHWVSEHTVTRGSSRPRPRASSPWAAVFSQNPPSRQARRAPIRYPALPYSARWLKPNAQCPVCGASVYFWSNENGSRVYFDEMGPPWPKHACTDGRLAVSAWAVNWRPRSGYRAKSQPGTVAHSGDFRDRFAVSPARAYSIEHVNWNGLVSWLHVRRVGWLRWRVVFVVPQPILWTPGQLIFVSNGRLSMLHPATLEVLDLPAVTASQTET